MTGAPVIAIIGSGFSGTLLAVQLARRAQAPLQLLLFDANGAHRRGVAYGTHEPHHLLNVRADKMGAFDDRQADFYRWLAEHEKEWRPRHPGLGLRPDAFMPRMLYGEYIESLYQGAKCNTNGVTIEEVTGDVVDAEQKSGAMTLTLADGTTRKADRLVLAIGNLLSGRHGFEREAAGSLRYTGNPWMPQAGSLLTRAQLAQEDSPVLIIGTGLTMVDMLFSLHHRGYRGNIIAVSRHGLLPQPHPMRVMPYGRFLSPETAPRTAVGLLSRIRREVKQSGADWRAVVDSLRGDTQALWASLPEEERRKLLRVLAYWSVHRHRMPVSSAEFIAHERKEGRLEILSGGVTQLREQGDRLLVEVRVKGKSETLTAAHVINCAGPGLNIDSSGNALLLKMRDRGYLRKGPAGLGIAAEADGRVRDRTDIYAIGPLLTGEKLETIAVPELRKQAEEVAGALLRSIA